MAIDLGGTSPMYSCSCCAGCMPINLGHFTTIPDGGSVDLSSYFGHPVVTGSLTGRIWRIVTDSCQDIVPGGGTEGPFDIVYYTGTLNPAGSLNPGTGVFNPLDFAGFNAADQKFTDNYLYPQGFDIQVSCPDPDHPGEYIWPPRDC